MNQYLVGHRGAAGIAPENTLRAFRAGLDHGADVIECDVHLSQDKEIVVIHDNVLDATTNGSGWVGDHLLTDLRRLDAGDGEVIPTLLEVVDLAFDYGKPVTIDIKRESAESANETAERVGTFIAESGVADSVVVHSCWHEAVKLIKERWPQVKTAVSLTAGLPATAIIQLVHDAAADGATIDYDYVTSEVVDLAHAAGLFIDAWVLDYNTTFTRMRDMGVNGLITNHPERFSLR